MTTVHVPSALRELTGCALLEVDARDVRGVLRVLDERFPGFREGLGADFAVAVDGEILHDALLEPVSADGDVHFLPPISGGSAGLAPAYEAPLRAEDAVALLARHGESAKPLAGGTDLLVQMRTGGRRTPVVVDLKRIPELVAVHLDEQGARLGAACATGVLREHGELAALWPGLLEAAELIGSEQIQGRASLGGNLCNASPAADTVPALLVNEARCEIAGPGGRRTVPADGFCTGPGTTSLDEGEILVALHLDRPPPRCADAYLRLIPRTEMDIAVAGAAVRIRLDGDGRCAEARVAIGAVGPVALRVPAAEEALRGRAPEGSALAEAAAAARAATRPIDDRRGTVAYRERIAGVLVERAARIAAARAAER